MCGSTCDRLWTAPMIRRATRRLSITPLQFRASPRTTPPGPSSSSPPASNLMATATASPLFDRLRALLGPGGVITAPSELVVYECDGYTIEKNRPHAVVFPTTAEQVAAVVRLCNELDVPFVPRGAGTSLAGGCLPVGGGVMIALTRMRKVHEVNLRDRYAVVEPGVVNLQLTNLLKPHGLHFAPDPSSQGASTVGGNSSTNAGGPHTLKYGVTANHVLG